MKSVKVGTTGARQVRSVLKPVLLDLIKLEIFACGVTLLVMAALEANPPIASTAMKTTSRSTTSAKALARVGPSLTHPKPVKNATKIAMIVPPFRTVQNARKASSKLMVNANNARQVA